MAYATEDRLSSSIKSGPLTLWQKTKIFGDPKGKVYYFNITADGKLQCFEDEEHKKLKEQRKKEDISGVQLVEKHKDLCSEFILQFNSQFNNSRKECWVLESSSEKERAEWVQAFTSISQPLQYPYQMHYISKPLCSEQQHQEMTANIQYTSCPYPIIENPLLPPVPVCGRLDDVVSYPDTNHRPSFLKPELIKSLDSQYSTINELPDNSALKVDVELSDSKPSMEVKVTKKSFGGIKGALKKRMSMSKISETPLHSASIKTIQVLLNNTLIDPNAKDVNGYTALHWYVIKPRKHRHELLIRCLESGHRFDIDAKEKFDNTALHIAAERNDLEYARILVAFGAQIYLKNSQKKFPYMLAPAESETFMFLSSFSCPTIDEKIYLKPPVHEMKKLDEAMLREMKIGDMMQPHSMSTLVHLIDDEIMNMERAPYVKHSGHQASCQASEYYAFQKQREYLNSWRETGGNRILFLDGGGIRGMVQIEVLMELERRTGCKVVELFDWIVGTSTGGLLALGLVYAKKSLSEMKQIYFQIKNKVFVTGSNIANTYMSMNSNSQNMEEILKNELGDAPMSSIQKPRVMICTVNKEFVPLKVQFFNNFMTEHEDLTNVPVWYAARATSAAPIYFTPLQNKYIDGGVKANNPCLEAMRVIKEYDQSMGLSERHFLLTVSIGTGMYADKAVGGDDLEKGLPLIKHVKHLKQLVNLFIQELGNAESTAQTFSIMCQTARTPIPCFRFNPLLEEEVSSSEINDKKIVEMILKTKLYLGQKETKEKLDDLVCIFRQIASQSL